LQQALNAAVNIVASGPAGAAGAGGTGGNGKRTKVIVRLGPARVISVVLPADDDEKKLAYLGALSSDLAVLERILQSQLRGPVDIDGQTFLAGLGSLDGSDNNLHTLVYAGVRLTPEQRRESSMVDQAV
jgi:hypothetical protein